MGVSREVERVYRSNLQDHVNSLSKEQLGSLVYELLSDEMERIYLAIEITGNKCEAGRVLGTSERTIFRRLKSLEE